MLNFRAEKFVELTSVLRTISMYFHNRNRGLEEVDRQMLTNEMSKARALLEAVGLRMSVKKARAIAAQIPFDGYNTTHFSVALDELKERIKDELEDGYFLHLSAAEAALFEPGEPLCGPTVHANFQSAHYDIAETGKCLALGRSTAAVMHSMRALEPALRAMAIKVGYTPARETWSEAIDEIENRLNPKHVNYVQDKDTRELLAPAAAQFRYFKDAWRNHAMHSREKYTPEEADIVSRSVKSFMVYLAEKGLKE